MKSITINISKPLKFTAQITFVLFRIFFTLFILTGVGALLLKVLGAFKAQIVPLECYEIPDNKGRTLQIRKHNSFFSRVYGAPGTELTTYWLPRNHHWLDNKGEIAPHQNKLHRLYALLSTQTTENSGRKNKSQIKFGPISGPLSSPNYTMKKVEPKPVETKKITWGYKNIFEEITKQELAKQNLNNRLFINLPPTIHGNNKRNS